MDQAVLISPPFGSSTLNYSATVDPTAEFVKVKPTAISASAIIRVNNIVDDNGKESEPINLNAASNSITIVVDSVTTYLFVVMNEIRYTWKVDCQSFR